MLQYGIYIKHYEAQKLYENIETETNLFLDAGSHIFHHYDNYHFLFEVEDNAEGMDKETQSNIFKEFFSSKGDSGTGLGLMVVERIIKNHQHLQLKQILYLI